jgi:hypothetical protein
MQDGVPNYYSNGTVFYHLYRMNENELHYKNNYLFEYDATWSDKIF